MDTPLEFKQMNLGDLLPKPPVLSWSLQPEWKQCGNKGCHCYQGNLHGPYWYRRWREDGKQRKAYVPREQVRDELLLIKLHRSERAAIVQTRKTLARLEGFEREILA